MNTEEDLKHYEKLNFDHNIYHPIINKKRVGSPSIGVARKLKKVQDVFSHKSLPKVIFELIPKSASGVSPRNGLVSV